MIQAVLIFTYVGNKVITSLVIAVGVEQRTVATRLLKNEIGALLLCAMGPLESSRMNISMIQEGLIVTDTSNEGALVLVILE